MRPAESELTRYQACLEVGEDGTCMAHVPELIGCVAVGSTREETLERLRTAVEEHLAWLAEHREVPAPANEPDDVQIEVVEEVTTSGSYPRRPGEPVAFFSTDEEPLAYHDLQTAIRLMEHARRDLLEFLRDVPESLLDWRPSFDEPSIAELLVAMAHGEAGYLARLDEASERYPFPQMSAIRSWLYHRLSRLTEAELSRLTEHGGERWSARKMLRRLLEDDREHTDYIHSLLARYQRDPGSA